MIPMMIGDILKYTPTSTVGKVLDIKEEDGKVWVQLDFTKLYYDATTLVPADESEYKTVSFKEREKKSTFYNERGEVDFDPDKMEKEVDITDLTASGGG